MPGGGRVAMGEVEASDHTRLLLGRWAKPYPHVKLPTRGRRVEWDPSRTEISATHQSFPPRSLSDGRPSAQGHASHLL